MRVANVKLSGDFKGFTRVSFSFMVYTTVSTLSTNSPAVSAVAALEGGRRDAGCHLVRLATHLESSVPQTACSSSTAR